MSKSLMISIRPKHLVNILNGNKTLELRKTVPKDFKGWVYLYCTKARQCTKVSSFIYVCDDELYKLPNGKIKYGSSVELMSYEGDEYNKNNFLNGKVVARFWFDEHIAYKYYEGDNSYFAKRPQDFGYTADEVIKRLCLSRDEFKTYGKGKDLYAWHIKKLEIFDKPKELGEFYKLSVGKVESAYIQLDKAPQSWRYVYYAN